MNSNIIRLMLPAGAVAAGLASCQRAEKPAAGQRPNVVVIYVDDMSNAMCGAYGGYGSTPNIDRLAENGIRFTRFYPSSPVSQPSRYTLLTGRYASRNLSESLARDSKKGNQAFVRWNTDMSEEDVTLPQLLGRSGYHTGMVGKWHLGFPNYDPQAIAGNADANDPAVKKYMRENYDRTLAHVKRVSKFDEVINLYSINIRWIPVPDSLDRHNQDWLTQGAVDFLDRAAAREGPFFLYMATTLPHIPDAIQSLKSRPCNPLGYTEETGAQPSRQSVLENVETKKDDLPYAELEHYAAVKWLDDGVGAVMARLDSLGVLDNTLVIFASDNDERSKMACYDGKVPMIMQWPARIAPGGVCDELVSNIDIAPTLYDLCGVEVPQGTALDGMSLSPLLDGHNGNWRQSLYLEILYTRGVITKTHNYVAVRYPQEVMDKITPENRKEYNQEGTKISQNDGVTQEEIVGEHVRYGTNVNYPAYYDFDQLYDLVKDPLQQTNLAYDKNHELELLRMKKLLAEYSARLPWSFGEFKQ